MRALARAVMAFAEAGDLERVRDLASELEALTRPTGDEAAKVLRDRRGKGSAAS